MNTHILFMHMNLEETPNRVWIEKRNKEQALGISPFRDLEQKQQPAKVTEKAFTAEQEESNRVFFQNQMKWCFRDRTGLDQTPLEGQGKDRKLTFSYSSTQVTGNLSKSPVSVDQRQRNVAGVTEVNVGGEEFGRFVYVKIFQ